MEGGGSARTGAWKGGLQEDGAPAGEGHHCAAWGGSTGWGGSRGWGPRDEWGPVTEGTPPDPCSLQPTSPSCNPSAPKLWGCPPPFCPPPPRVVPAAQPALQELGKLGSALATAHFSIRVPFNSEGFCR